MQVCADSVTVAGPHGPVLPPTSVKVEEGGLEFVHGEPGPGVTAFGLALTGRLKPATGTVTVDGAADAAKLRQCSAVVDAPGVSEPEDALPLRVVVGEELALGGRPAGKDDVARWLAEHDVAGLANVRFENVEAPVRTRLLTELAAGREGVRLLVLDTPDRHTSDVDSWVATARAQADRGLAVVVLTATTPPAALPATPARIGDPS
ncbi:ABC transporter ATP-binding protein [Amycolatopsis bartoniae]|uniref:ABC transporter ATP-binding protein n=1 Tax=Amycolatopsis bartoniae TaxID=941986 RepID=UPI00119603E0|nr:ABC transporter ATP-binding protein [Amycolatopsis bartoniae]TVT07256.1 ABC transporter ATP-binding protein [Amycolatopsis bartoniae]